MAGHPHPELTPDEVAELLGADALDACTPEETTANGLTAHDLVVHIVAQESLLAHEAGVPLLPELAETDTDAVLPKKRGAAFP